MIILLYGPPGGGKNTQGEVLAQKLGLKFVSTGTELRAEAKSRTPAAKIIREYLRRGTMLPASAINPFMRQRLLSPEFQSRGYVTDGFPRQAEVCRDFLSYASPTVAIFLLVPNEVLMERLLKRGREDDKTHIIRGRLETYQKDIAAVRPILEAVGVPTFTIDGTGDKQTVEKNIWDAIEPFAH